MIFLQPHILWALPLIALPLLIHLLNRLRYRSVGWGAMSFLLAATRRSTRHARVREWLLLLCRMVAIAGIVLALSRPQVGGWLGRYLGGPPETVLLLLDRSASMGSVDPITRNNSLSQALQQVAESLDQLSPRQVVLLDSLEADPIPLPTPTRLAEMDSLAPTDAGANLPHMLQRAAAYLTDTPGSAAEIWIISDLQRPSWEPDADRWQGIRQALQDAGRDVRLRILATDSATTANRSLVIQEAITRSSGGQRQLLLSFTVQGPPGDTTTLPINLILDGSESRFDLQLANGLTRQRERRDLGDRTASGWGVLQLPADANPHDNMAFFVYGQSRAIRTVIVAESQLQGNLLRLAAAPLAERALQEAELIKPEDARDSLELDDVALLVWQGDLPAGALADQLHRFARAGGQVLLLPGTAPAATSWEEMSWLPLQSEGPYPIKSWHSQSGLLADTDSGTSLPLDELVIEQRRLPGGNGNNLATFADGAPLLLHQAVGKGAILMLATSVDPTWSSLHLGPVLVPLLQRLGEAGAQRLDGVSRAVVGDGQWPQPGRSLRPVYPSDATFPSREAGIWQVGSQLVGLNVPSPETSQAYLSLPEALALLEPLPAHGWLASPEPSRSLQTELTPWLWLLLLLALAGEGLLTLPKRLKEDS